MKYTLLLVLFFFMILSEAQETNKENPFTQKENSRLLKLDIKELELYSYDNTQINNYLKDVLILEKKRVSNNTVGYIMLGIGVLSTILGEAIVVDTNNNSNGDIISSAITEGAHEVGRVVRNIGIVVSLGSVPFFINADSKKNQRNQKINKMNKLF